ncbi:kielin/chordin-like protein [Haliotis rubra]|uniref:kielin/chordin-like protein n=1 Tax=Haliotis rubra TaxID=36100 RepID=UPI001EE607CF|nr:kielin/chordin-like protein [Haliotis rubra]
MADFAISTLAVCCCIVLTHAAVKTCTHNGVTYEHGDSWVADDSCNGCDCTDFGTECGSHLNCNNNNLLGKPGDPLCRYGYQFHRVGESWLAQDHCNNCNCTVNGMICTYKPCKNTGFDKPKDNGGEFMDCPYKNVYYHYGAHFLADNGCNTCICVMPGNYATFPVCTMTKCTLIG